VNRSGVTLYLRLLSQARPYWKVALISGIAMLALGALEPMLAALMQPLVDRSLIEKDPQSIWQVPLFIVAIFISKGIAEYIASLASQTLAQKTIADLRSRVFMHQLDLPLRDHQEESAGRMLSRLTYDTAAVAEALSSAWLILIRDTCILIGLFGFLFYTSWQLTLMVLVLAPIVAVLISKTSTSLRQSNANVQGLVGQISGLIEEALLGLKEIKLYAGHAHQGSRFGALNLQLMRQILRVVRVQALNVPLVQVVAACSVAAVIYAASHMAANNQLSPGEFVAFIAAVSLVFEPVRRLTNLNAVLQRGLAAAESLFTLLDRPIEMQSARTAEGQSDSRSDHSFSNRTARSTTHADSLAPDRAKGEIVFRNVRYRYPHQQNWAINGVSLQVNAHEVVTIVGPSGVGKSTLLYLLAGFDTPTEGEILLDGKPLSTLPPAWLRSQIALVGQQVVLFNETIAQNIRMGRPTATMAEIEAAARAAHAWEFIAQLPQGLDTPLGSLGDRLSGGQRQRIAIARAFLKDAPILLLDEATSALDAQSETAVLAGLRSLMHGRTVVMVSHAPERLSVPFRTIRLSSLSG